MLVSQHEKFVRLCVERRCEVPASLDVSGSPDGKSPKIFGLPRPYTGLYSASSYMANRPSYMRNREPGQYTLGSTPESEKTKKTSKLLLRNMSTEVIKNQKSSKMVFLKNSYIFFSTSGKSC